MSDEEAEAWAASVKHLIELEDRKWSQVMNQNDNIIARGPMMINNGMM